MNQPPQIEKQASKGIISRGEYAVENTLAVGLSGIFLFCILSSMGLLLNYASVSYKLNQFDILCHTRGCSLYEMDNAFDTDSEAFFALFLLIPLLPVAYGGWRGSRKSWDTVRIMKSLTRANTADLPVPTTLVRASAPPMQEHQAVLLRAATDTQERHEEQLVRASAGGE